MNDSAHFLIILGEIIRASRKRIALSQSDLAEKAGVSKRFLRDLEHGRTDISVMNLSRIMREMEVPLSNLFIQIEEKLHINGE